MHTPTPSLRRQIWQEYRKSGMAVAALWLLGGLVLVALLAPLLANALPLYCVYGGKGHFPVFTPDKQDSLYDLQTGVMRYERYRDVRDWRAIRLERVVRAPVPYSPGTSDPANRSFASPFARQANPDPQALPGSPLPLRYRHWLGTNRSGEDVLAHLIHGTRISLLVGLVAVGLAALVGALLGSIAGYYGNHRLRLRRGKVIGLLAGLLPAWFYGFYVRRYVLADAAKAGVFEFLGQGLLSLLIAGGILLLAGRIGALLSRKGYAAKAVALPVDGVISRLIEVLNSIPLLLLILSISHLFEESSLLLVMAIIGLTGWTGIARLIRGEFLRIIQLDYMESARALGIPERSLIWRHAFPNGLAPLLVVIALGMGSAIIIEAGLAFLNIGVPQHISTWGNLLSQSKADILKAWWLALPPSFAIFLTVLAFNLIGERLRDVLDPRTQTHT